MQINRIDQKLWGLVIFEINCLRGLCFQATLPLTVFESLLSNAEE